MSASQPAEFNLQQFTDLGAPLAGGRLYTYAFGTTTQKNAFTDIAGAVPHTYTSDGIGGQYIALNSRGELPAPLYLGNGPYDLALKTAAGATIWTRRAQGALVASNIVPVQLASAATVDIGGQGVTSIEVTGNTNISSFGTNYAGPIFVRFLGSLTLIHNATTLAIPGGSNATIQSGDIVIASGNTNNNGWNVLVLSQSSFARLGVNADITALNYASGVTGITAAAGDKSLKLATTEFVQAQAVGQCYLSLSGGNLKLSPYNGNKLTINGGAQTVPSAGVTLAPAGLTVGALIYIYAYMSGATMTLEASTTGHATDSTTGVEIKSGDATRTLVGMCVPQTGPAFADSGTKRLVLSWFNRRNKEVNNLSIAGGTTGSATAQEINSSDRILFLSWNNDAVNCYANVSTTSNNSGSTWAITFGLDGTGYGYTNFNGGTAIGGPVSLSTAYCQEVSEGSHYATVMGQISGGNTLTVQGGGTSTIRAIVRG